MEMVKPKCKLIGEDGNVFAIMGQVGRALRASGQSNKVNEFMEKVTSCRSYDEALRVVMEYVEVE